jgi:hypothetical protein
LDQSEAALPPNFFCFGGKEGPRLPAAFSLFVRMQTIRETPPVSFCLLSFRNHGSATRTSQPPRDHQLHVLGLYTCFATYSLLLANMSDDGYDDAGGGG